MKHFGILLREIFPHYSYNKTKAPLTEELSMKKEDKFKDFIFSNYQKNLVKHLYK